MSFYDNLVHGIDQERSDSGTISTYLDSLKPNVRMLRSAYRKHPVFVPYEKEGIQSAYLITYLPHYYQLIEKVLREQNPDSLSARESINITFIGGGPGSEVYGAIKYILAHSEVVQTINVSILDINAETWNYSHQIVLRHLINKLPGETDVNITWNAYRMDLIDYSSVENQLSVCSHSDLVVIQNCINEISSTNYPELSKSIAAIFNSIPARGALLMIDLTQSVRSQIGVIEAELKKMTGVKEVSGTLAQHAPSRMVSINARPNDIIRKHLLDYSDGLIPRKNLTYDYSYISKSVIREQRNTEPIGLKAIYEPLNDLSFEEVKNRSFVGLDFGTSVSVCTIVYVEDGNLKLKNINITQKGPRGIVGRSPLVPTAIGVSRDQFMIGKYANDLKGELRLGRNSWYGFKQMLGALDEVDYPDSILKNHPEKPIGNAKEGLIAYLGYLNDEVKQFLYNEGLPQEVYYSVSIPANFPDYKKAELKEALISSGINYESSEFVFEPISALVYALYNEEVILSEGLNKQNILVIDIGAGTLDISILAVSKDGTEYEADILAVERIDEIGGEMIDQMIFEQLGFDPQRPHASNLVHYCEKLKISMCKGIAMDSRHQLPSKAISDETLRIPSSTKETIELSYSSLHSIMNTYWEGVLKTVIKGLQTANLSKNDIHDVILSGGGGKNPYMRSMVREYFNNSNFARPDNIQEQVARGNALQCFISNSFGKYLINARTSGEFVIHSADGSIKQFGKGTETPSLDLEIFRSDLSGNRLVVEAGFRSEQITFEVPNNFENGFLYLTSDHELKLEIIAGGELHIISPTFNKTTRTA